MITVTQFLMFVQCAGGANNDPGKRPKYAYFGLTLEQNASFHQKNLVKHRVLDNTNVKNHMFYEVFFLKKKKNLVKHMVLETKNEPEFKKSAHGPQ